MQLKEKTLLYSDVVGKKKKIFSISKMTHRQKHFLVLQKDRF